MKFIKNACVVILLLQSAFGFSQPGIANYINNGSFELASPNASSNPFYGAVYWSSVDSTKCSSHYIFSLIPPLSNAPHCQTGFQYPRNGNNFVLSQFYSNVENESQRFYPRNRLKKTLRTGVIYCAKYYIVNTNYGRVAIDKYGMCFGNSTSFDTISKCEMPYFYLSPQIEYTNGIITDTLNWTAVSGTFVADGTEKYALLGNFRSNQATNTVLINPSSTLQAHSNDNYLDDVSVIEMELPAYAGPNRSLIPGDSTFIGREPDIEINESCIWYQMTSPTTSVTLDTIAGLWVKPVETTTYVVRQQLWCSGVKWDTVVIYKNGVGLEKVSWIQSELKLFPVPADKTITVSFQNSDFSDQFIGYAIYSSLGERISERKLYAERRKSFEVPTDQIPDGSYLIQIRTPEGYLINKPFVILRN
jgi:hypothetical protein